MPHVTVAPGSTDVTLNIFIPDSSSSLGGGLTGLVYNSSNLVCYYSRARASATQLSLNTQTVTGSHSDGGFVEISSSNMPGWYRLDLSDAIIASSVDHVTIDLHGATNMVPVVIYIDLIAAPSTLTAAQVWDYLTSSISTSGSIGKLLKDDIDTTISSRSTLTAAGVWDQLLSAITTSASIGKLLKDDIDATVSSRSTLSQADIRTAVGLASANLDTQLDALPTASENSTAVWAAGTRTLTSFGTLVADVWAYASRTLTAISDSAGVTTLLTRIASALNISSGKVEANIKQINSTDVTGDGDGTPWGPA